MPSSPGRPLISLLFAISATLAVALLLSVAGTLAAVHWIQNPVPAALVSVALALFLLVVAAIIFSRSLQSLEKGLAQLETSLDSIGIPDATKNPAQSSLISENLNAALLRLSDRVQTAQVKNLSDLQLLTEANKKLKISQQSKNQFVANMSHEIRTPLNGIIGTADLLLQNKLSEQQEHLIQVIRNAGEDLLIIVNDILDLSKLEHGNVKISATPFDLCSVMEDVVVLLRPGASEKNILIQTELEQGSDGIYIGDAVRLRQVLLNLLANAIKFTERGHVKIIVRRETGPQAADSILWFAIQDSGIGISPSGMSKLFLPFSQIDNTTTRHYEGAGLGLAICKRLVELMQGGIWVESKEGIGSTFHFKVKVRSATESLGIDTPANLPQLHPIHDPKRTTRARIHRKTSSLKLIDNMAVENPLEILLAEDNPVNMQVALGLLSVLGYQADTVTTGNEVISALGKKYYDVILLDIQMPEMDGVEATRLIRESNPDPHRPYIIAVTANALFDNEEACREVGMNDYINKPLRGLALQFALKRAIEVLSAQAAPAPIPPSEDIDNRQIRELLDQENQDIAHIFTLFVQDTRDKLNQITAYDAAGDMEKVRRTAHQIKGGASNFGLISFCNLMNEIEAASHQENPGATTEIVEQASPIFEQSLAALARQAPDLFQKPA